MALSVPVPKLHRPMIRRRATLRWLSVLIVLLAAIGVVYYFTRQEAGAAGGAIVRGTTNGKAYLIGNLTIKPDGSIHPYSIDLEKYPSTLSNFNITNSDVIVDGDGDASQGIPDPRPVSGGTKIRFVGGSQQPTSLEVRDGAVLTHMPVTEADETPGSPSDPKVRTKTSIDLFSVMWNGAIQIENGWTRLRMQDDDRSRIIVGTADTDWQNDPVVDVSPFQGTRARLEVHYLEFQGNTRAKLQYQAGPGSWQTVPEANLFQPGGGSNPGLIGDYYEYFDYASALAGRPPNDVFAAGNLLFHRLDRRIDFGQGGIENWGDNGVECGADCAFYADAGTNIGLRLNVGGGGGAFTLTNNAQIDVTGKGFPRVNGCGGDGFGEGNGKKSDGGNGGGGGAHGGLGGFGNHDSGLDLGLGGLPYDDDPLNPIQAGSSGAAGGDNCNQSGSGQGGGVVIISAGTITLERSAVALGLILADALAAINDTDKGADKGGGAAGGSINLTAGAFTTTIQNGARYLSANGSVGGNDHPSDTKYGNEAGGSGSGGRISVSAATSNVGHDFLYNFAQADGKDAAPTIATPRQRINRSGAGTIQIHFAAAGGATAITNLDKRIVAINGQATSDIATVRSGQTVRWQVIVKMGSATSNVRVADELTQQAFEFDNGYAPTLNGRTIGNPTQNGDEITWYNLSLTAGDNVLLYQARVR